MAKISMFPADGDKAGETAVAGIWLTGKRGVVGLVADDNIGTYICFYGPEYRNKGRTAGNNLPALVISLDEQTQPQLQVPGGPRGVQFISLYKLLSAFERLDRLENCAQSDPPTAPVVPEVPDVV